MSKDAVILVVDDERDHADGMVEAIAKLEANAIAVYSGEDALDIIQGKRVDVVITDLKLGGDIDGLVILEQAKRANKQTQVILVTAYATIETCKQAIKAGAYDYLVKPIDINQLRSMTEQVLRKVISGRKGEIGGAGEEFVFEGVKGEDERVRSVFEVLRRVAPANISVLIEGESGTGKELLARAIHNNSPRRNRPFRPINCAGLAETLLESELFGHVKGAFTGAASDRKGLFEIADKGTLFLDEIGDMPMNMQAKLLRVIEDGIVIPVGSHKSVVVDVRIISATNQDLGRLVKEHKFRQDLYFRIKGVSVTLPALRERVGDIAVFIDFFIKEASAETGSSISGITEAARNVLVGYSWPGNIRQLRNCIRTMVVMCESDKLDVQDIPPDIRQLRQLTDGGGRASGLGEVSLGELEKQAIIETLAKTGNNREKAAKILGIGERTLYRKIKEYNL
jgi:two-component system response regulator HydG